MIKGIRKTTSLRNVVPSRNFRLMIRASALAHSYVCVWVKQDNFVVKLIVKWITLFIIDLHSYLVEYTYNVIIQQNLIFQRNFFFFSVEIFIHGTRALTNDDKTSKIIICTLLNSPGDDARKLLYKPILKIKKIPFWSFLQLNVRLCEKNGKIHDANWRMQNFWGSAVTNKEIIARRSREHNLQGRARLRNAHDLARTAESWKIHFYVTFDTLFEARLLPLFLTLPPSAFQRALSAFNLLLFYEIYDLIRSYIIPKIWHLVTPNVERVIPLWSTGFEIPEIARKLSSRSKFASGIKTTHFYATLLTPHFIELGITKY